MVSITQSDLSFYTQQGYLIIRSAFSQARIQSLIDAVERLMDRALADECEIGWIDRDARLLQRTGSLLSPDKYDSVYGEWIDGELAPHLEALITGGEVRHSLFGMLAGGGGQAYRQNWHRDLCIPGSSGEAAYLRRHHGHFVQYNVPLLPGDRFLNIVPTSHLRASSAAEIQAAEAGEQAAMPDAISVELEPGDAVYYNANLWHRGWNPAGINRWTMHAAFWSVAYPVMKHECGQREAMLQPGYLEQKPPITTKYIRRYLEQYPEGEPQPLFDL